MLVPLNVDVGDIIILSRGSAERTDGIFAVVIGAWLNFLDSILLIDIKIVERIRAVVAGLLFRDLDVTSVNQLIQFDGDAANSRFSAIE